MREKRRVLKKVPKTLEFGERMEERRNLAKAEGFGQDCTGKGEKERGRELGRPWERWTLRGGMRVGWKG